MLNRVMIIGRLGQDPQLKYSQTGSPIATFSVATDETFTDRDGIRQQRTEWFRVVVFQKTAENCSRYLHKGSLVYVEGSLQTRKWQDQQGFERSLVEIRAQRVDFLEKKSTNEEYGRRSYQGAQQEGYLNEGEYRNHPQAPRYAQGPERQGYQPRPYDDGSAVFPKDAMNESYQRGPEPNYGETKGREDLSAFPPKGDDKEAPSEGSEQSSSLDTVPF